VQGFYRGARGQGMPNNWRRIIVTSNASPRHAARRRVDYQSTMDTAARSLAAPPSRLGSIDAYRGLVMFLMMAEVLHLSTVGKATGSAFWKFLGDQQTHAEWFGCSLHD